jgi:hypothetical protein
MEGEFHEGVLHGRGSLQITVNGTQTYAYVGVWQNGHKHGKGTERTQTYNYEGSFHNDAKHGKGTQTFVGSAKEQH